MRTSKSILRDISLSLIFFFSIISCSDLDPKTCECKVNPLFSINGDNPNIGGHAYYDVFNFDAKNKDCYDYLVQYARDVSVSYVYPITIHFFDNLPDFQAPSDGGMYGSEEVQNQVIYQHSQLGYNNEMAYFDPFGSGKYERVK